jgi:hypothetical protein
MKSASEKRKRGRPFAGKTRIAVAVILEIELIKAIDVWARARELERSSAIRRLIDLGIKMKR